MVRALLDSLHNFIGFYYAITAPRHTDSSLKTAETFLLNYQRMRYYVFLPYSASEFKFPKNHSMLHYIYSITRKGTIKTTDTQHSERAHIAKKSRKNVQVASLAGRLISINMGGDIWEDFALANIYKWVRHVVQPNSQFTRQRGPLTREWKWLRL